MIWAFSLLVVGCLSPIAVTAARDFDSNVYTICMNPWDPLVTCENDVPHGLDVLELGLVFNKLGWEPAPEGFVQRRRNSTEDSRQYYRYKCVTLEELLDDLSSDDGSCHLGGSLTVTSRRLDDIVMSSPTYRGHLAVLTTASYHSGDGWGFVYPVTATVWALVLLTGLVLVPILMVLFEYFSEQQHLPSSWKELSSGMSTAVWNSFATLLQLSGDHVRTVEARILMVGYAFFVLIIITVYTANMTANITLTRINAAVNSPAELSGHTVATWNIFSPRLSQYGIDIYAIEANEETMRNGLNLLRNGTIDAMVMAAPWVTAVLKKQKCPDDLFTFELDVEPYDYSLPFPKDVPQSTLWQFNRAIMELSEEGTMLNLHERFTSQSDNCLTRDDGPATVLGIWQIYGLWVIMGGCVFLAFILSMVRCGLLRRKHKLVRIPYTDFDNSEGNIEMGQLPPVGVPHNVEIFLKVGGQLRQLGGDFVVKQTTGQPDHTTPAPP